MLASVMLKAVYFKDVLENTLLRLLLLLV